MNIIYHKYNFHIIFHLYLYSLLLLKELKSRAVIYRLLTLDFKLISAYFSISINEKSDIKEGQLSIIINQARSKNKMHTNEQMDYYLKTLSLTKTRETYLIESENAAKAKLSYQDYLYRLAEAEVLSKIDRSINRKLQVSGFPMLKKLEEFDFSYQPKIDEKLIRELSNLNFMDESKNLIFLGPPGVGKTHLAISFGVKACLKQKRVSFYSADALTQLLSYHDIAGTLKSILETLSKIDLLIIDELGYLEFSKKTASLFFQLIAIRYEKKSTIITSNKQFDEWGQIFNDDVVAAAIIDRLLHHSYPFFINGKSYRMKNLVKN